MAFFHLNWKDNGVSLRYCRLLLHFLIISMISLAHLFSCCHLVLWLCCIIWLCVKWLFRVFANVSFVCFSVGGIPLGFSIGVNVVFLLFLCIFGLLNSSLLVSSFCYIIYYWGKSFVMDFFYFSIDSVRWSVCCSFVVRGLQFVSFYWVALFLSLLGLRFSVMRSVFCCYRCAIWGFVLHFPCGVVRFVCYLSNYLLLQLVY